MSLQLKDLNLLYIDDVLSFSNELEEFLAEHFHQVIHSETFIDHVKIFKEIFIDLIIVNVDNEKYGGVKFVNLIKKNASGFPIIALSKHHPDSIATLLNDLNILHTLPKPCDLSEIKTVIDRIKNETETFANERINRNIENLDRSLDSKEALQEHFKLVITELMKYDRNIPPEKKMNFSIMKGFLFTAYNNLKSLDINIQNESLKIAKRKLDMAIGLLDKMDKKTASTIEESYKTIYLMKQLPYVKDFRQLEENKEKIFKAMSEQKVLQKKVEKLQREANVLSNRDPEQDAIKSKLHQLNKSNVDLIQKIRTLRDSNETIYGRMHEFSEKNFEAFQTDYKSFVDEIKEDIVDTLNVLAYRFDKELWRSAKRSKPVQKFFTEARIEGLYSSKTYMKYYISKLDIKKAGDNTTRLIRYIEQYNKKNPVNVAIIGDDMEKIQRIKTLTEKIDNSVNAIGFLDPKRLIETFKITPYDLVVMEFSVSKISSFSIAKTIAKAYPTQSKETVFFITIPSGKLSYAESAVKEIPATIMFNHTINPADLQEKIMMLL